MGAVDETPLTVVYSVADFVNKIAFVLHTGKGPRRVNAFGLVLFPILAE